MQRIVFVPMGDVDARIAHELAPPGFEVIQAAAFSPDFTAAMPGCDYLVGLGDPKMTDAFYATCPNLKLVQLLSAGYDRCDIEAARKAKVPIANNGGANSVAVASISMMACSATATELAPPLLAMGTFALRAASMSQRS